MLSVVTDKFIDWSTLPQLAQIMNEPERARIIKDDYLDYHHLVSAFTPEEWVDKIEKAGFQVEDYIPIVTELVGRFDLLVDTLWHVKYGKGEFGGVMEPFFRELVRFPEALRGILHSLVSAEKDQSTSAGVVFLAKKKKGTIIVVN